jgi:protein-S-isoprenylcysteine O-methyltransferase Ste14
MKYLQTLATVTVILQVTLMIIAVPNFRQVIASVLNLCSLIMFWSAKKAHGGSRPLLAFAERIPFVFIKTGPYRFVRHPFYASYLYAWIGGGLAAQSIIAWVPVAALILFYHSAASREEDEFLKSPLSESYEAYQRKTKRFVPYML